MIRIFKLKGFARFQRKERISDHMLRRTILDIESGLVDAELGGGLVKQRLARPGQGKRGSYRTIIAIRFGDRAFFLFGFAKNERSTIDPIELEEFKFLARGYLSLTAQQLDELIKLGDVIEVVDDENR